MRECDAAAAMGLSPETPVAIYATQGLRQLAIAWSDGSLWGAAVLQGDDHELAEASDAAA
ncbi:MAG: hypothetical protein JWM19_864 [Actinomycetia bacterium]|nr:hypothetical protein [Actinomycetes bacterium]